MTTLRRRALSAVATGALLLGTVAVTAAPAQAAPVSCTYTKSVVGSTGYWTKFPYHPSLKSGCQHWYTSPTQKGAHVGWLQRTLNGCYGAGLSVDGSYGPRTRDAVRSVQSRLGLKVDGYYGPQTARAMKHARYANSTTTVVAFCGAYSG